VPCPLSEVPPPPVRVISNSGDFRMDSAGGQALAGGIVWIIRYARDRSATGNVADVAEPARIIELDKPRSPSKESCYGSALRWRIGRPGAMACTAATMALASMP
jgi:hypothetical protein